MRRLKQISLAVVLMFTLATGAMAGISECPPAPAPATETIEPAPEPTLSAEPATRDESDPTIDLALIVLQSVLFAF